MTDTVKIAHIIAAAGSGRRFGAPLPKQFCPLPGDGRPLLMTTIERLRAATPKQFESVTLLVLNAWMIDEWLDMCAEHSFTSPAIVEGGDTRWASVKNALDALSSWVRIITVHDGARPVVTPELLAAALEAVTVGGHSGAIPTVPVTDSLRCIADDGSSRAVDRSTLRAVQTPQVFRAEMLKRAYELPYSPLFTDDASVMEAAGFTDIALTTGDPRNIKVTHPGDLQIAAQFLIENR